MNGYCVPQYSQVSLCNGAPQLMQVFGFIRLITVGGFNLPMFYVFFKPGFELIVEVLAAPAVSQLPLIVFK